MYHKYEYSTKYCNQRHKTIRFLKMRQRPENMPLKIVCINVQVHEKCWEMKGMKMKYSKRSPYCIRMGVIKKTKDSKTGKDSGNWELLCNVAGNVN
jgi:hypothetical protein